VPPAVRSGDTVAIRAAVDGVTIQGEAVATQSGVPGDTIRVVNPSSHRTLTVRVVGLRQVEVVQ
jgi:flagella basal body P-ring formation protein FlgA